MNLKLVLFALLGASVLVSSAKTITIGGGKNYATPAEGFDHLASGDTVIIDAGEFKGSDVIYRINQSNVTIQGAGIGKTIFDANGEGGNGGRGMFVPGNVSGMVVEGITFTGETQDSQAAVYAMATGKITFRNCRFEKSSYCFYIDSASTAEYYFENCEFQLGDRGLIYTKSQIAKLSFVNCKIDSASYDHNGKDAVYSLALETYFQNCTFDENKGKNDYYNEYSAGRSNLEINCPKGGQVSVLGCSLNQTSRSADAAMIRIGDEYANSSLTWRSDNTLTDYKNNKDPVTQFDELVVRAANCELIRTDPVAAKVHWTEGEDYDPAAWVPSASNALFGVTATGSVSYYTADGGHNLPNDLAKLTDGKVVTEFVAGYPEGVGIKSGTLTYTFDEPVVLRELRFFTFWKDGGRDGIKISKVMATVSGGGAVDLISEEKSVGMGDNDTSGHLFLALVGDDGEPMLGDAEVTSVSITFPEQDNAGTGYVEIEAICDEDLIEGVNADCTARGVSAADDVFTLSRSAVFFFRNPCLVTEDRNGVVSNLGVFAAGTTATVPVSAGESVTWTLTKFDADGPYVVTKAASPREDGSVAVDYMVISTGGSSTVPLSVKYWIAGGDESLAQTMPIASAGVGSGTAVMSGLVPNRDYLFKVVATDGNDQPPVSLHLPARAAAEWSVGVWQRKVATSGGEAAADTGFTNSVFDVSVGRGEWDRVLEFGTLMAYTTGNWYSEYTTLTHYWNNFRSFIYEGYVYLQAGNYSVISAIDDTAYLEIDGTVIHNVVKYQKGATSDFTVAATGWHAFKAGVGDYTGGHGPIDGDTNSAFYLRYNGSAERIRFLDPWDGSLLRVGLSIGLSGVTVSAGVFSATIDENTAALLADSQLALKVGCGKADCETWASSDWDDKSRAVTRNGRSISFDYSSIGSGVARFFLVNTANGKELFASDLVILPSDGQVTLSASADADGSSGNSFSVSCDVVSLGGAASGKLILELATEEDFSNVVTAYVGDVTMPGLFNLPVTSFGEEAIVPGGTYRYRLSLKTDGGFDAIPAAVIKTSAGAVISSASATAERWNGVFIVALSDVGAGNAATVYLLTGDSSDSLTNTASFVFTQPGKHDFDWEFPFLGRDIAYRFVVSNACSVASWGSSSEVKSVNLKDDTTYYWKNGVTEGVWSNHANWTDAEGNALDARCVCPNSTESRVSFGLCDASAPVVVLVDGSYAVRNLQQQTGLDLVFRKAPDAATAVITPSFGGDNDQKNDTALSVQVGSKTTFDGVDFPTTAYYLPKQGSVLRLTNGARMSQIRETWVKADSEVIVEKGSSYTLFGRNDDSYDRTYLFQTDNAKLTVDDSTFDTSRYCLRFGYKDDGKSNDVTTNIVVVAGANPVLKMANVRSHSANEKSLAEFLFRVDGPYATVPLTRNNSGLNDAHTIPLNNEGTGKLTFAIAKDSPAFRTLRSLDICLVEWAVGIDPGSVILAPSPRGTRSRLYYTYGCSDGHTTSRTAPANSDEKPTGIWVRFESSGTKIFVR